MFIIKVLTFLVRRSRNSDQQTSHSFVSSIHNMKKIAVAITGASVSIYAKLLLEKLAALKEQIAELSIVLTDNAKLVWQTELDVETYNNFEGNYFTTKDFSAPFASVSAKYDALIVLPCSMSTLGRTQNMRILTVSSTLAPYYGNQNSTIDFPYYVIGLYPLAVV